MYWAAGLLLALLAFGYWYLHAGLASAETHVDYSVSITDPASGRAKVSLTVDPGKRLFLDLYLRDSKLRGEPRVENVRVTRAGNTLWSWLTVPWFADLRRVWTGGAGPVTVEYDINPLWLKGDSPRSYLGRDFAYLRGMALLYTPVSRADLPAPLGKHGSGEGLSGTASLEFTLPEGWQVNSPWFAGSTVDTGALRNVYFGLGRLGLQTARAGETEMQLAVYAGLSEAAQAELTRALLQAFRLTSEMMQIEPRSQAPVWSVSILPDEPIHGGAAGTNSLICSPDLGTLVHEMFHWWNGNTLQYASDANWIHEGFTTYYQGKLLRHSGSWSDTQLAEYLDRKYSQIPNAPSPIDLSQASTSLVRQYSRDGYYRIYSGGACVAAWLDRELQQKGRSLDEVWPELVKHAGPITTDAFLTIVESLYDRDLAQQCRLIVQGQQPVPAP